MYTRYKQASGNEQRLLDIFELGQHFPLMFPSLIFTDPGIVTCKTMFGKL
jgi:hypothetical protein